MPSEIKVASASTTRSHTIKAQQKKGVIPIHATRKKTPRHGPLSSVSILIQKLS